MMHYNELSIFEPRLIMIGSVILQIYIFPSGIHQNLRICFLSLIINCIIADKSDVFFRLRLFDLISTFHRNDIFKLTLEFVLNNFDNFRFVFHNLLILLAMFKFRLTSARSRYFEKQQQNSFYLINLIACN